MDEFKIYNPTDNNWMCLDTPGRKKSLIDALEVISFRGLITMDQMKILKDLYVHEKMSIPEPIEKIFKLFEQEEY